MVWSIVFSFLKKQKPLTWFNVGIILALASYIVYQGVQITLKDNKIETLQSHIDVQVHKLLVCNTNLTYANLSIEKQNESIAESKEKLQALQSTINGVVADNKNLQEEIDSIINNVDAPVECESASNWLQQRSAIIHNWLRGETL